MTIRALSEVFIPGASALPERLRTLSVTPTRFIEPGTTVEATFGFYNSGGATATGLRVRFAMPEGLGYIPGSARVDGVAIGDADGVADGAFVSPMGAVLGEIGPGVERRVTILYRVADLIEDGTTVSLQAAIAANETLIVGSNVVRLVARSRPLLENAQTSLTLETPAGPEPGREVLIRARLTNLGQSSASDVVLVLPVPEHTRYSPRSARVDGRPVADDRGAPFEASASTVIADRLTPGQSVVADFIAVIETPLDNGTLIAANARVSSRELPEFEILSNEVAVASMPSFDGDGTAFIIEGDDEVVPGMRLRMALRAANVGTSSARRVIAQITMPTGLVYSPGSGTLDGLPLGDDLFDSMTYAFESIAPGRAAELAFDAVVVTPAPPDAKLPVAAKLSWESGDRPFKRTLTIRSEPRFTRVKNIVERAGPPLAQPGEEVTFVIHIVNEGTAEATDARLILRLDKTLSLMSAQSGGRRLNNVDGAIILGALAPHVEQLITVVASIASPIADRSEVAMGAELETRQLGTTDLGIASYTIRSRPRFSAEETRLELRTSEPLRPSRSVQVAVRVVNSGTDIARDVRAIFSHPPELAIEPLGGAPLVAGELIFDAIAPAMTREALVDVRLASFVPNGSSIALEARLEAAGLTPLPLRPVLLETRAEAEFAGEIELVTSPSDAVDAGSPLSHTLRFRNVGDGPAQSIVVRVRPPERVVYVPASTSVNGMRVDDENGASPLWALHGLILTDVDPGVPVTIRWETIVTSPIASGTLLSTSATLQWDEQSLTVVSDDVVVRSSPEFASSPGGRSISIARLIAKNGPELLNDANEPQALPRPRPVGPISGIDRPSFAPPAPAISTASFEAEPEAEEAALAPSFDAPSFSAPVQDDVAEPSFAAPEADAQEEEFDLPFFTAPPSAIAEEEVESTFSFADGEEFAPLTPPSSNGSSEPAATEALPIFGEPPARQEERLVEFGEPPSMQTDTRVGADLLFDPEPQHDEPAAVEPVEEAAAEFPSLAEPDLEPLPELDAAPAAFEASAARIPGLNEPLTPPAAPAAFTPRIVPDIEEEPVAEEPAEELEETHVASTALETREPQDDEPPRQVVNDASAFVDEVARAREQRTATSPITVLAFAPDRLRRTLSFLQQSDYGKLVSHLFALEAFFPDRVLDEPELDEHFVTVRDAFRSTLDRLFVRLRLPRYSIASRDLEDRSSRDAVVNLVERVSEIPVAEVPLSLGPVTGGIRIRGSIDRASLHHALEGLTSAPIGGVTPWIACVALLGTTIESGASSSDALGTYRDALISVLRVLETLPMSEFHRVLTSSTNAELDTALHEVIRVLGGPVEAVGR